MSNQGILLKKYAPNRQHTLFFKSSHHVSLLKSPNFDDAYIKCGIIFWDPIDLSIMKCTESIRIHMH